MDRSFFPLGFHMFSRLQPFYTLLIAFWVLWGWIDIGHVWAGTNVAVLYPKVNEPYRSIFNKILEGIESDVGSAAKPYPLSEDIDYTRVKEWLQKEQIRAIIALGKPGFVAALAAGDELPVVTGALQIAPGNLFGISLSPDPTLLFKHLKELVPKAKGVHVVYTESTGWLIKLAESAARARGLRFTAYPVHDLREAVRQYQELLRTFRGPTEAIWLPLDHVSANEDVILPMLLQAAWDRDLVIFSSKPSHAQRGALFSLFPDYFAMGQSLARMALHPDRSLARQGVIPLADVKVAVNLRTALHLGLRFTPRQQERFGLLFPSR